MTNDELKTIEDRANAATPGPWESEKGGREVCIRPAGTGLLLAHLDPRWASSNMLPLAANADFIIHSRTDIPALIAEVRRLQTLCASHEEYIEGSERDAH